MFRKDNTYYKNSTGLHTYPSDRNYLRNIHVKDFFFEGHSQGNNESICPSDYKWLNPFCNMNVHRTGR